MLSHLKGLDGFRGIAALLVLFSHLSNQGYFPIDAFNLQGAGKIGVWMFFSLSAFLLWRNSVENKYSPGLDDSYLVTYAITRFFRIVVPFGLLCLIAYINFKTVNTNMFYSFGLLRFIDNITMQKGYGVLWSIVVEVKFYLTLPLFYFLFRNVKSPLVGIALCIGLMVITRTLAPLDNYAKISRNDLSHYLPIFIGGFAAYYLYKSAISQRAIHALGIVAMLLTTLTIPGIFRVFSPDYHNYFTRYLDFYAVTSCVMVAWVARGGLKGLFGSRPLLELGKYSFGIYMLHPYAIRLSVYLLEPDRNALVFICALLLSGFFGWLFFYSIERPCIDTGKKILNRWHAKNHR